MDADFGEPESVGTQQGCTRLRRHLGRQGGELSPQPVCPSQLPHSTLQWGPLITANNWSGGVQGGYANLPGIRSATEFAIAPYRPRKAVENFPLVLEYVGASLPKRDSVDTRVIEEVRTGTGHAVTLDAPEASVTQRFFRLARP